MTQPQTPHAGGCLCGAIRYSVNAPIKALRVCHCTHCQRTSGTGASVNAVIQSKDFALTKGVKTARVRSVWNIRPNENAPRLISCYVL